jgi:hypothetical protein
MNHLPFNLIQLQKYSIHGMENVEHIFMNYQLRKLSHLHMQYKKEPSQRH